MMLKGTFTPKEDKGMSESNTPRETLDHAIRQIHAQPEVYCNTLQAPTPSDDVAGATRRSPHQKVAQLLY